MITDACQEGIHPPEWQGCDFEGPDGDCACLCHERINRTVLMAAHAAGQEGMLHPFGYACTERIIRVYRAELHRAQEATS